MSGIFGYLFGGIAKRFSVSTHHYLNEFEEPLKKCKSSAFLIRYTLVKDSDEFVHFVPEAAFRGADNACHFMQRLTKQLKGGQRAIITSVSATYNSNDVDHEHVFHIRNMFQPHTPPPHEEEEEEGDGTHPDKTGHTTFIVPPLMRGPVPLEDRVVYEPNLTNAGINVLQYAGMEDAILNPRSGILPRTVDEILGDTKTYEVFQAGDAAAVFVIQHRLELDCLDSDVVEQTGPDGEIIYMISKTMLDRVRSLFRTAVFPLLLYTQFDQAELVWDPPTQSEREAIYERHREALDSGRPEDAPTLSMLIVVDYLVITPGAPVFKTNSIDLGV